jgi:DNA-binding beta-propeller fold protein YncE
VLLENIADPSAVAQLAISSTTIGSELGDIAVAPNGASLVVALNSPKGTLRTLALPSLTATAATYPMNQPRSVAISPAGGKVAAGSSNLRSSTVTVFNTGNPLALSGRGIGDGSSVIRHFVAFSANGAFLYAVTPTSTGHYAFRTLQVLPMTTAQFNLKASKPTVAYGAGVTLSVHLGVSTTNRTVSIYRQPYGSSTPVLSHTGKVGTGGNLTFVAHPITKTIYTVRWSGDATHLATTPTARTVQVSLVVHRQTKGGYSTASGIRLYHYAASCGGAAHTGCPTFQAWTSPLQPARTMTYTVQGKNTRGTWVTVLTGGFKTGAGGKLTLTITYKGTGFVGVNQRIRFKMQKSNEFVGQTSSWLPFRITT